MKRLVASLLLIALQPQASALTDIGPAANFILQDAAGNSVRLSEYRGQVVLINFWSSWCRSCRQEFPHLDALHQKYADQGFTVLGVNVEQDRQVARRALEKIPVVFPVLFDDENRVSRLYDVDAMPATLLIDRNGIIRFRHRGYKPGYEDLYEREIRVLIREQGGAD